MPGRGPFNHPYSYSRPFDWEREQVFSGYDPVVDGFAYPLDTEIEPSEACLCTQDPESPHNAIICENCFERLLSES